ncbi:UDP-3-O-acyl-N-acetylglucosamine deacetylase [Hyphococcus sp.]|uniref:UDP-3-O-acyl-N-acetylglucosamine deacetylase n=1 Tax=Hyphococcus sp. TaxID=2038636 RepID=UPI003CCBFD67
MKGRERQRTLNRDLSFVGVGLHSGAYCEVTLKPAEADTGVVFHRSDLDIDNPFITASPMNVVAADHGTSLANEAGAQIATVEHLMAALALCGVDNVLVEVNGPEIPILDGSSREFVSGLSSAGCAEQDAVREPYFIHHPIRIGDDDRFIEFSPGPRRLKLEIEFNDCLIGRQSLSLDLDNLGDLEQLASARTFCRIGEVEHLREAGLIRGGTLANSVVVDGDRVLNEDPLRNPQEFALHKALDLIGDLYLLGAPVRGSIHAVRPGHFLNTRAARAVLRRAQGETGAAATVRESLQATA